MKYEKWVTLVLALLIAGLYVLPAQAQEPPYILQRRLMIQNGRLLVDPRITRVNTLYGSYYGLNPWMKQQWRLYSPLQYRAWR